MVLPITTSPQRRGVFFVSIHGDKKSLPKAARGGRICREVKSAKSRTKQGHYGTITPARTARHAYRHKALPFFASQRSRDFNPRFPTETQTATDETKTETTSLLHTTFLSGPLFKDP
jgi:hypothetical protein